MTSMVFSCNIYTTFISLKKLIYLSYVSIHILKTEEIKDVHGLLYQHILSTHVDYYSRKQNKFPSIPPSRCGLKGIIILFSKQRLIGSLYLHGMNDTTTWFWDQDKLLSRVDSQPKHLCQIYVLLLHASRQLPVKTVHKVC